MSRCEWCRAGWQCWRASSPSATTLDTSTTRQSTVTHITSIILFTSSTHPSAFNSITNSYSAV